MIPRAVADLWTRPFLAFLVGILLAVVVSTLVGLAVASLPFAYPGLVDAAMLVSIAVLLYVLAAIYVRWYDTDETGGQHP